MPKIDIISSCLVPMATNNAISISRMELTPWDLQCLPLNTNQKGILFHKPDQSQQLQKNIINHLKNSLSRTLDFFPPLSGRLGTIKNDDDNTMCYFIDCNNAGAEFSHAVADDVSVSDILNPTYVPEIVYSLFPLNEVRNFEGVSKPLLGVQVTELVDGYFIACTANLVVADGTSFWHFFNSWSEISRGFDTISKIPIFDRWFPINISNYNIPLPVPAFDQNLSQNDVVPPPPLLGRVFHFSKESVAKLKSKAISEVGAGKKISSLQVVSAHLWRSVIRCRINHQEKAEVSFSLLIGGRPRIPLPEGYFGNAIYIVTTKAGDDEVLQKGLGFSVIKINELIAQQTKEAAIKFVEDWVKNPKLIGKGKISFLVSNSPTFNVYGNDFGWGKPIAVRVGKGQKLDGTMATFPTAIAGGIDVQAFLAPETMRALEADAEFMEAVIV